MEAILRLATYFLSSIQGPIRPYSRVQGHVSGRIPQSWPLITVWRAEGIRTLLERGGGMTPINHIVSEVAARFDLGLGYDRVWRGRCPLCAYAKPTLELKVEDHRIAVSCASCGAVAAIAAALGLPSHLVAPPRPARRRSSKQSTLGAKPLPRNRPSSRPTCGAGASPFPCLRASASLHGNGTGGMASATLP
jgi:hypothetical protein